MICIKNHGLAAAPSREKDSTYLRTKTKPDALLYYFILCIYILIYNSFYIKYKFDSHCHGTNRIKVIKMNEIKYLDKCVELRVM